MSLPSFTRLFKKVAGMTFVSYVTHVRLSRALRLLKESSLTVAEVASRGGIFRSKLFRPQIPICFRANSEQRSQEHILRLILS